MLDEPELARRLGLLASVVYPRGRAPGGAPDPAVLDPDAAGRLAARYGVPPGYLVDASGDPPVEAQLELLGSVRRWDDRRLGALLGELEEAFVPSGENERFGDRRPACLRAVPTWAPTGEDELRRVSGDGTAVWRRCQQEVRELDRAVGLDGPIDAESFLGRLAEHRGRGIELRPFQHGDVPGGVCGLWIALTDSDVIGYPVDARHALHIVLHEVGHMLRGHNGRAPVADSQLASFMPDLDPAMVRSVLGRSVYSDVEEREAELIASLIMHRSQGRGLPTSPGDDADPVSRRLRRAFGG